MKFNYNYVIRVAKNYVPLEMAQTIFFMQKNIFFIMAIIFKFFIFLECYHLVK
jgi:hypothetical protein